jgi:hypothetical protein
MMFASKKYSINAAKTRVDFGKIIALNSWSIIETQAS